MAPFRTMCEVLDEMRRCFTTRNFASIMGLIEEVQSMGNRMEAALEEYKSKLEEDDED